MVASIPKELLVHSLQYEQYNGINSYGDDTFSSPVEVSNVRVEETVNFRRDVTENIITSNFVIFYDGKHSQPSGLTFEPRSKLNFNGRSIVITKVLTFNQPFSSDLHHIELEGV